MSEGAGDERQVHGGRGRGLGVQPFEIYIDTPLDCKKISFLSTKIYLMLERIGFLLHGVIHQQKCGGCSPRGSLVPEGHAYNV